jgi:hypothetical protein
MRGRHGSSSACPPREPLNLDLLHSLLAAVLVLLVGTLKLSTA